jgi:hypothetical protein
MKRTLYLIYSLEGRGITWDLKFDLDEIFILQESQKIPIVAINRVNIRVHCFHDYLINTANRSHSEISIHGR